MKLCLTQPELTPNGTMGNLSCNTSGKYLYYSQILPPLLGKYYILHIGVVK